MPQKITAGRASQSDQDGVSRGAASVITQASLASSDRNGITAPGTRRVPLRWRALAALVACIPFGALPLFGAVLAFIAFDVLRIRRGHVRASLARIGVTDAAIARASYRSLGAGALELLWIAGRPRAPIEALVRVDGWEKFLEARGRGRGVIVATAHTGNWDLAACACAAKVAPHALGVVTKRLSSLGLDAFWQTTRRDRGLVLVPSDRGVLREVRAQLARGDAIALLVDQDPERTTSVAEADFLGARALHDTFAATLAARTGAPIVVAFARRVGRSHVVDVVDVHVPPVRASAAWIAETTVAVAAALDRYVRADPSCWLWLHRRWKTRPRTDARTVVAV